MTIIEVLLAIAIIFPCAPGWRSPTNIAAFVCALIALLVAVVPGFIHR